MPEKNEAVFALHSAMVKFLVPMQPGDVHRYLSITELPTPMSSGGKQERLPQPDRGVQSSKGMGLC